MKKTLSILLSLLLLLSIIPAGQFAAAKSPLLEFKVQSIAEGKIQVSGYLIDCIGLKSGDLEFHYDASKMSKPVTAKNGQDAKTVSNLDELDNSYNYSFNETAGLYSFYFKHELWDSTTWAAKIKENGLDEIVNADHFEFVVLTFPEILGATFSVTGVLKFGNKNIAINNIISLDSETKYMGDVDDNGKVEPADARLVLRAAVSLIEFTSEQEKLADIDSDDQVTPADARSVLRMSVGLDEIITIVIMGEDEPINTVEVSFDLNYENAQVVPSQRIQKGEKAVVPNVPDRENYQLIGWYREKVGSIDLFDFNEPIENDTQLYARWYDETDTIDSDDDGMIDSVEVQFGSNPMKSDTDNDGVSDFNELNWLNLDPSTDDYNHDGIKDGEDDPDNDKLTNAEETQFGTNPTYSDSDFDFISDYDEINIYYTDPLIADTDEDGVLDGIEVQNNSDPLVPETVFETETSCGDLDENTPVAVSAIATTDNAGAGTLEIREISQSENPLLSNQIPGRLGPAYDFTTDGEFVSAQISFRYDKSLGAIGDDFQPRIYYVNEENGVFEELEDQTVENGVVTATVNHFSTYILLNKVKFDEVWDTEIKPPQTENENADSSMDVVFVIDYSMSMDWNDSEYLRKTVTKDFVEKLRENQDNAAVVSFISIPSVLCDLTSDKQLLIDAIDSIINNDGYSYGAGTNGSAGINSAITVLNNSGAKNKYIVFLTDGEDTAVSYSYDDLIDSANQLGIIIYSIGLGTADEALLTRIAEGTGGKYYKASVGVDLSDIYDDIESETIDYSTDSNSDGICDYYTNLINSGRLLPSNGTYEYVGVIDMYGEEAADWDGDGLLNGEEIQIAVDLNGNAYIKIKSNPLIKDTDGDNLDDYTEVNTYQTSPLKYTKPGGLDVQTFVNDDSFVYVEHVNQQSLCNSIAGLFDWQKTNESKATYIDYFYDYASEGNINATAKEREQLAKREKAWEIIETITDFVKIGKDFLDLGTDLSSYDSVVKGQVTRYNNLHKNALNLYNKKDYDAVMKSVKGLDGFKDDLSVANDVCDFLSGTDVADKISATLSVVTTTTSMVSSLGKVRLNLGDKINTFSRKYQTWLGKRPTGDVSIGTVISVAADAVDLVTDVADLTNLYGKLQANSEAFNEYIELIEYVSNYAENDYTRIAAGEIARIVLDKSNTEYYRQLNAAIAETSAKAFINIAITIVGDFCPYVKVAKLVVDVIKIAISITGITAYAKALVKSQAIYAISQGCNHYLFGLYEVNGDWYSFDINDYETIVLYLTQLAQSRIVGEDSICTYLKSWSLANWISKLISRSSNEEIENNFNTIIGYLYSCAEDLKLQLSKGLPRYPDNYSPV